MFVMCTIVYRVHMNFYKLTKGYTVPGNQGTHDKHLYSIFNPLEISQLSHYFNFHGCDIFLKINHYHGK